MDILIIFLGSYLHFFIIAIALLGVIFVPPKIRLEYTLFLIFVAPLAYLLGELVGMVIYNPRPFVALEVLPLIPHDPTNGFPSTHALVSISVAFAVFVFNKKLGFILFLFGILVGVGRIFAQIHSVEDVLGSVVVAAVAVCVVLFVSKRFFNK
jgi:undecaprenyl-diphosphatase